MAELCRRDVGSTLGRLASLAEARRQVAAANGQVGRSAQTKLAGYGDAVTLLLVGLT